MVRGRIDLMSRRKDKKKIKEYKRETLQDIHTSSLYDDGYLRFTLKRINVFLTYLKVYLFL